MTKPVRITWGMVNAAVVQGKIIQLPGEICLPELLNGGREQSLRRCALKGQKSAEVENPRFFLGKGLKAV